MTETTRNMDGIDCFDDVDQLITQIQGILDCIAYASQTEGVPDLSINNACWAASNLAGQLRNVVFDHNRKVME